MNIKYLRTRDGQKWYGIRDTNRITFAANWQAHTTDYLVCFFPFALT